MDRRPDSSENVKARRQYAEAFDYTMIRIWRDRLRKLRVKRSGELYDSVARNFRMIADSEATSLRFAFGFRLYGIFVERGTGRETFRGNNGDIGRPKVRRARPWMSRKYMRSVLNIRDFMAESLAMEAVNVVGSISKATYARGAQPRRSANYINNSSVPGANLPS